MKTLIVNPNVSASVTELISQEARRVASPDTQFEFVTASFGVDCIETRAELAVAAHATLAAIAAAAGPFDAAVIAAFGDPGLGAARELLDVPVVGIAEASMLTACMLGRRFSIISISTGLIPLIQDTVSSYGLASRLASVRTLSRPLDDVATLRDENREALLEISLAAVKEDGADVIIFGGGPLAGLGRQIADRIPIPSIDGTSAAIRQAEALHALAPKKATSGTYRRPDAKPSRGLSRPLAQLIEWQ